MKYALIGLLLGLSGCASTYVETGPLFGDGVDNGDVPWIISVGQPLSDRCSVEVFHISSVMGGYPFYHGSDDVSITGVYPSCRLGGR